MMRREEPAPAPTPIRWWRLGPWSRNHLMRRSDRYEATLVLLAATLILLLIPFAAAYGTATHTRLEQQTQAQRTNLHQVPAVLLEDTHPTPDTPDDEPRPSHRQDSARVRWSTPTGDHTAVVPTEANATAGQTITISVDTDGNLTGPIRSNRDDTVVAVTAACGAWALGSGGIALVPALGHALLTRTRMRQWAREWTRIDTSPR